MNLRTTEMKAIAKTLLFVLALMLVATQLWGQQPRASTTVVVVRHAEKVDDSADPLLSEAGAARARALAAVLKDADVAGVYTTQYQRTRLTGEPTAQQFGITPVVIAAGNPMQAHLDALAEAVRGHAGRTVLIVGHSNTVPLIVRALGGPDVGPIADSEYDNLFVLTLTDGSASRLVRAKY